MKSRKKITRGLTALLVTGLIIGTLGWELLERILSYGGVPLELNIGPFGFDLGVLKLEIKLNPGSFLGTAAGYFVFRRI